MSKKQSAPGKGYDNPKHWGQDMELGDIFQVTRDDANENGNYIFGDFYIAQTTGPVGTAYYPYFGNSTNVWKHAWTGCQKPQLLTSLLDSVTTIYANGAHCAAIDLYFTPNDVNGNTIPLSNDYFLEVLKKYGKQFPFQLIQYLGEPLPDDWASLTAPTSYTAVIPGQQAQATVQRPDPPTGTNSLRLYISSSVQTDIQLGIQVTTADGTSHIFDSTGGAIEPVTVKTLSPITYYSSQCTVDESGDTQNSDTRIPRLKNFYLHPTDSNFRFVHSKKISGGITRDFEWNPPTWPDNEMVSWVYWYDTMPAIVGTLFYWNMDLGQQTKDGLGMIDNRGNLNNLSPEFSTSINEKAGLLNVTLTIQTWQEYSDSPDSNVTDGKCKFRVYDQYGNSGQFGLSVSDYSDPNPTVSFPDV